MGVIFAKITFDDFFGVLWGYFTLNSLTFGLNSLTFSLYSLSFTLNSLIYFPQFSHVCSQFSQFRSEISPKNVLKLSTRIHLQKKHLTNPLVYSVADILSSQKFWRQHVRIFFIAIKLNLFVPRPSKNKVL